MSILINIYDKEKTCCYRGEVYSVRDNGAVMRHSREGKKPRTLDEFWTFGTINSQKGYLMIASEAIHRIVATAFLGDPPTKQHVVDHIDTNRQNNRPENLRWVTRLENIILNDITRKKLELLCGCSIEEILSDLTILRNKPLTPQFDWMKTVNKEEAEESLTTWKKWVNEIAIRREREDDAVAAFKTRNKSNSMVYPLEPSGNTLSLEEYYQNLKANMVFCYKSFYVEIVTYKILEFYLNKNTGVLFVATTTSGGIKSLYLTSISIEYNAFVYTVKSFFSPDDLDKYMTLVKGEEWTGGEVYDDFC